MMWYIFQQKLISHGFHVSAVRLRMNLNVTNLTMTSEISWVKEKHVVIFLSCLQAVIELKENLRKKQSYLANHIWFNCRNCMDAMTASLVESCNHAMKIGTFSVHFNMNLETTCAKVLEGVELQIQHQKNTVEWEMGYL